MTSHPRLAGRIGGPDVADRDESWPVASSTSGYQSPYLDLDVDVIVGQDGEEHSRVIVRPHGAVGVLALDEDDRVLLVQQYRHAVGRSLVELPAGTLDIPGESPLDAAVRELGEEADVEAADWEELTRLVVTPGYSTERWVVYRATGLTRLPEHAREAEEAQMQQWWVPFATAVDAALAGRISDAMTVAGLLTEHVRRS